MNGGNRASSALLAGMEKLLSMAGREVTDQPFQFVGTNILCKFEKICRINENSLLNSTD